jgi:hypothetical protein
MQFTVRLCNRYDCFSAGWNSLHKYVMFDYNVYVTLTYT